MYKNRLGNATNPFQGKAKKVLCVCSAGLLRSPTTAVVLSQYPYNFNTRAVGLDHNFALIPIDKVMTFWADEIVCMDKGQALEIRDLIDKEDKTPIVYLNVPDRFDYMNDELVEYIKKAYDRYETL